jgi:hypothetical protein
MKPLHIRLRIAAIALLALSVIACQPLTEPTASRAPAPALSRVATGEIGSQLARLKAVTARFQRFEVAQRAGYSVVLTPCMTDPTQGGMGFHYGKSALIDGSVDVEHPEVLLYEPQRNGELQLVGVEYIIPFGMWTAAQPPVLFGQTFKRNETFGLWALHAWVWEKNRNGTFADWNPRVTCAHAH